MSEIEKLLPVGQPRLVVPLHGCITSDDSPLRVRVTTHGENEHIWWGTMEYFHGGKPDRLTPRDGWADSESGKTRPFSAQQ